MATIVGMPIHDRVQPRHWRSVLLLAAVAFAAPCAKAGPPHGMRIETLHVAAPGVSDAPLRVRVAVPARCRHAGARCDTLYVDDGQDAEAVGLFETVASLDSAGEIRAPVVVAVDMPADRMGAYGFSDRRAAAPVVAHTRYGDVGARAHAYSDWLARVLVPRIEAGQRVRSAAGSRAILGWSLGGAHAFNMAWQYPDVFGRAGAFSPSFWLSTDPRDAASVQRTRIAQSMLLRGAPPDLRLFLSVGTDEEQDDRDGDGVNDAVDDVRELVDGTPAAPGLRQLGYRIDGDRAESAGHGGVHVYVLPGGIHRQPSWARMLPAFLRWAYGANATGEEAQRSTSRHAPGTPPTARSARDADRRRTNGGG
jgi:predicted alpha/beta superfamily hydrolase